MKHLHVRCPSCAKLYQIDVAAVFSTSPHFQCVACPARFTFDFPPQNPEKIETRHIAVETTAATPAKRKCPKCGAESPKTADECYSCHVIFEKLEGLPTGPGSRVQPSLVRRWKEVLEDYTDDKRHIAFIEACRKADALTFARDKYEHIRRMQGTDDIADRMLRRVVAVKAAAAETEKAETPPRWMPLALSSPFILSALMILWGFTHSAQRNMVGAGIAVALLSYGLITGVRGRLTWRDLLGR